MSRINNTKKPLADKAGKTMTKDNSKTLKSDKSLLLPLYAAC